MLVRQHGLEHSNDIESIYIFDLVEPLKLAESNMTIGFEIKPSKYYYQRLEAEGRTVTPEEEKNIDKNIEDLIGSL